MGDAKNATGTCRFEIYWIAPRVREVLSDLPTHASRRLMRVSKLRWQELDRDIGTIDAALRTGQLRILPAEPTS